MIKPIQIAISVGEPAGIGSDLLIMLAQKQQEHLLIAFCDPHLLSQRAKILNLDINIIEINYNNIINRNLSIAKPQSIYVLNTIATQSADQSTEYKPGILDKITATNTLNHLEQATLACLNKHCDALVTCPIQKSIINYIDDTFIGHTEYLEQLCNQYYKPAENFKSVMMLMSKDLKVALVTTHIPLIKVVENITESKIIKIAQIINTELKAKFKIIEPHIMITGLNPHAGEDGKLGHEENNIIIPAIKQLQEMKINATGAYAADSIFSKYLDSSALILAMYHDQGLTGFKARAFNTATNVTLGLPIIRTSVDHGTALDLAGTGNINISSLEFAIKTACDLAGY
jgi:4-hydroxythreonine-4-phosphate dehydrogenase